MTTMGDEIVVAVGADANFRMQLATLLASISATNPGSRFRIFVLHDGFDDDASRAPIVEAAGPSSELEWIAARSDRMAQAHLSHYLSVAALFRLALPALLPDETDRVLYLDADTLVLAPLQDLWHADLGTEHLAAAVRDPVIPWIAAPKGLPWRDLALPPSTPYFNSGVLMIPLDRWRATGIGRQALDLLVARQLNNADQCALNAVIAGNWRAQAPRWNLQAGHLAGDGSLAWVVEPRDAVEDAIERPAIVHFNFAPRNRPWLPWCTHAFQDRWFEMLDRTVWTGWRPEQPSTTLAARAARKIRRRGRALLHR